MSFYEDMLRPLLFRMDPERVHDCVTRAAEMLGDVPGAARALRPLFRYEHDFLKTTVAGLHFPNPVGLAAGFDKDCRLAKILPSLGFGFLELGTVTPRPQPGNSKPRLFRIAQAEAIINRMGFNNCGAEEAARRLERSRPCSIPLGINIGMNADTPIERAHHDYAAVFNALKAYGDYFVINVSSPNTRGLRDLQERLKLERILTALRCANRENKPLFVKLSPDILPEQWKELVPLLLAQAQGVVISNTTLSRAGIPESWADQQGGLSGAPLRDRSTAMISEMYALTQGMLPIIGAGGIFTAEDAYQKLRVGASLVQVYTGLVYRGPGLPLRIKRGLADILEGHHLKSVAEAVGRSGPDAVMPVPVTP